jgi:hypothetical protein
MTVSSEALDLNEIRYNSEIVLDQWLGICSGVRIVCQDGTMMKGWRKDKALSRGAAALGCRPFGDNEAKLTKARVYSRLCIV